MLSGKADTATLPSRNIGAFAPSPRKVRDSKYDSPNGKADQTSLRPPPGILVDGPPAKPLPARPRNRRAQNCGDGGLEIRIPLRIVMLVDDLDDIAAVERGGLGEPPGQIREEMVEILVLVPVGDPSRAVAQVADVDLHLRAGIDISAPRANEPGVGGIALNIDMGRAGAHVDGIAVHDDIRTGGAQHRFEQPIRVPAEGRFLQGAIYVLDIIAGDQRHLHVPLDLRAKGAQDQGLDPVRDRVGKPRVGGGEGQHDDLRPPFQFRDQVLDKEIDGPLRRCRPRSTRRGTPEPSSPPRAERGSRTGGQSGSRSTRPCSGPHLPEAGSLAGRRGRAHRARSRTPPRPSHRPRGTTRARFARRSSGSQTSTTSAPAWRHGGR